MKVTMFKLTSICVITGCQGENFANSSDWIE